MKLKTTLLVVVALFVSACNSAPRTNVSAAVAGGALPSNEPTQPFVQDASEREGAIVNQIGPGFYFLRAAVFGLFLKIDTGVELLFSDRAKQHCPAGYREISPTVESETYHAPVHTVNLAETGTGRNPTTMSSKIGYIQCRDSLLSRGEILEMIKGDR